ncbi:MAG: DUF1499 domain-containing protein [Elusimicrobiota bacterium]|nr:DUF1499 domain-containing protein [Elusimicrobiota bacterium]
MRRLALLAPLLAASCAPLINDVTTTPDDPPRFRALPAYPPANAAVQRKAYPDLAPLARPEEPAKAFAAAAAAARRMPRWEVVYEDAATLALEAVAVTGLLRFKDDVVVRVTPGPAGALVHARSRSRVGKGDLGANAARLEAYLLELGRAP